MAIKKRVFISFDIDHDEGAKKMLAGQAKKPDSPFDFKDNSVKDHLTGDWKDKVKRRMDNVDVVIVLCGTKTHTASGVATELTIAKAKKKPYFLLSAYSDKKCTKPTSATSTEAPAFRIRPDSGSKSQTKQIPVLPGVKNVYTVPIEGLAPSARQHNHEQRNSPGPT